MEAIISSDTLTFLCLLITAVILFYIFAFRMKWRDILPIIFNPLIKKIPPNISPNQISVMGLPIALITALFIYLARYNHYYFIWAAISLLIYALVDSLDGILARARNQATKSGAFLDYTLDKLSYLALLSGLILGGHVLTTLVVISMLCTLFYSLINMESLALTGSPFPLAERPRWLILAIILCLIAFTIKLLGFKSFDLWKIEIRYFDALFMILPIYQASIIFTESRSLWNRLKKIDRAEHK